MDIKGIGVLLILGAFGGVVRASFTKKTMVSFTIFFFEALIGAFAGFITGILLTNYSSFPLETIYAICALSGVMARDLIPLFITIANRRINDKMGEK